MIRTPRAAGGNAAQHSQSLEAWFVHVPGLMVVMPSTPADAKGLLTAAIRDDNPVLFIEHKLLYADQGGGAGWGVPDPARSRDVKRPGKDVTIVTISHMVLRP